MPLRVTSAILAVCLSQVAWADSKGRIDRLTHLLLQDPSYKVRLQVAITLGKLRDRRAVPALIRALRDRRHTVRAVAAGALGQIGDTRAKAPLKRLLARERSAFVKRQARRTLRLLRGIIALPPDVRFYIRAGSLRNESGDGASELPSMLAKALLAALGEDERITTEWAGKHPSPAELKRRGIEGFVVDGSIVSISKKKRGSQVELSCRIKVALSTYPGNSMKAFYTGSASMKVPASDVTPGTKKALHRQLVEAAATGAQKHLIENYFNTR